MKKIIQNRSWKFLLLELLVVFIGVYGAFYLTTLREEAVERRNRVNYYETFLLNLDDLYTKAVSAKERVDSLRNELATNPDSEISINRSIDFTNNMLIVRSGFESENFTTIGKDYLASLDRGSNLISVIEKRVDILESETRKFLIYGEGNEEQFKKWYSEELEVLSNYLEALQFTISKGAVPETKTMIKQLEDE
ncbi:MAG TPA: hypothetical protein DF712_00925 [Balneola sp.]|nr:hypothetical protein [Bacteroidota bacterium]HCI70561.1 hypothetical protein [Balneola sp.]HCT50998.1 hypothetical protein [Balneola sp.]|tara:strand:+ start:54 stop:635 length:582 start_codon:yes stop_codon:yes gene_type:complete